MDLIGKADYNKQATQNGTKSILKSNLRSKSLYILRSTQNLKIFYLNLTLLSNTKFKWKIFQMLCASQKVRTLSWSLFVLIHPNFVYPKLKLYDPKSYYISANLAETFFRLELGLLLYTIFLMGISNQACTDVLVPRTLGNLCCVMN